MSSDDVVESRPRASEGGTIVFRKGQVLGLDRGQTGCRSFG